MTKIKRSGLTINLDHMHPRLELDGEYQHGHKVLRAAEMGGAESAGAAYEEARRLLKEKKTTPAKLRKAWAAGAFMGIGDVAEPSEKRKATGADAPAEPKKQRRSRGESGAVMAKLKEMLERKQGCTRPEILEATGWPSVSVQQQAKALGLKLTVDKEQQPFRYYAK
jgi:hypothetical protein